MIASKHLLTHKKIGDQLVAVSEERQIKTGYWYLFNFLTWLTYFRTFFCEKNKQEWYMCNTSEETGLNVSLESSSVRSCPLVCGYAVGHFRQ